MIWIYCLLLNTKLSFTYCYCLIGIIYPVFLFPRGIRNHLTTWIGIWRCHTHREGVSTYLPVFPPCICTMLWLPGWPLCLSGSGLSTRNCNTWCFSLSNGVWTFLSKSSMLGDLYSILPFVSGVLQLLKGPPLRGSHFHKCACPRLQRAALGGPALASISWHPTVYNQSSKEGRGSQESGMGGAHTFRTQSF